VSLSLFCQFALFKFLCAAARKMLACGRGGASPGALPWPAPAGGDKTLRGPGPAASTPPCTVLALNPTRCLLGQLN
jgi:hypothetical protein